MEQLKSPTEELSKSSAETQLAGAASQPGPSATVPGAPLWNAHVGNNLDWAAEVFRRAKAGAAARVSGCVHCAPGRAGAGGRRHGRSVCVPRHRPGRGPRLPLCGAGALRARAEQARSVPGVPRSVIPNP